MSNGQKSSAEKTFSLPSKTTAPYIQGVRHLLDDSVLEESPCASSDGSICGKILPGQNLYMTQKNTKINSNSMYTNINYHVSDVKCLPSFRRFFYENWCNENAIKIHEDWCNENAIKFLYFCFTDNNEANTDLVFPISDFESQNKM